VPNLKEIRTRIASVESTQKITSAMKLVSAAKLRRAQNAIVNLKPYSNKLNEILQNLSDSVGSISVESSLFAVRKPEHVVLIAITSNRGLCGAFNSNVIKEIHRLANEEYQIQHQKGKLKLICIGKKAIEQLQKNYEIQYTDESVLDAPRFEEIAKIVSGLITDFSAKKIDKIEIIYNHFLNPATQKTTRESFLPMVHLVEQSSEKNTDFILEPSKEILINELTHKILKLQLYKTVLDSIVAEHGARMTAMSKATENAIEILRDLKLKYNNARQAAITNELNEIVSGAEALHN